ncbi:hypothetical protein BPAE_0064g00290 [Botrytis paeoniae]|uniref:Uncharacterized protein n=1 Tax=Botrytis paeoniae TaxID=278948 RepID=A0A4Z1FVP8_9HELO|nr:hypothetical protein BPAE_0064g00290 [Botrytis paeoniae]
MYFLRYGVNAEIRAEEEKASKERELRQAEIEERGKELEAAHNKMLQRFDQSMADFTRVVRFWGRVLNYSSKDAEIHIEDDYARFEATDGNNKLTDLEILKTLILEYEEKYDTEIQWEVKYPVEYEKATS